MKTFIKLEKEIQERYDDKFDIHKIYDNIKISIDDALGWMLGYGSDDCFGGPSHDHDFSHDEKNWIIFQLIEHFINSEEALEDIENSGKFDGSRCNKSVKYYLKNYKNYYEILLEELHNLRNNFRNIKKHDPENYPYWIDEWEECLDFDIAARSRFFVSVEKNEVAAAEMTSLCKRTMLVVFYLRKRCEDLIEKYNTDPTD